MIYTRKNALINESYCEFEIVPYATFGCAYKNKENKKNHFKG